MLWGHIGLSLMLENIEKFRTTGIVVRLANLNGVDTSVLLRVHAKRWSINDNMSFVDVEFFDNEYLIESNRVYIGDEIDVVLKVKGILQETKSKTKTFELKNSMDSTTPPRDFKDKNPVGQVLEVGNGYVAVDIGFPIVVLLQNVKLVPGLNKGDWVRIEPKGHVTGTVMEDSLEEVRENHRKLLAPYWQ